MKYILFGFGAVLFVGMLMLLSIFVLQLFWNLIAHGVFGLTELSFLQACGLYFFLWIIGSFFKGGSK